MKLKELIDHIYPGELPARFAHYEITDISCDSREVKQDNLFVALKGEDDDGAHYVEDAIEKGASTIIYPANESTQVSSQDVCILKALDTRNFLKEAVKKFYSYSTNQTLPIGVTGTNGKTTITYLLESILKANKQKCGVIGTVNYRIDDQVFPSRNTTPGIIENYKWLAELTQQKIPYCIMEVSSHGLKQGRVDGIDFFVAIFTGLTDEHLDYHLTMEEYFQAKALLFKNLSQSSRAVINIDNPYGEKLYNRVTTPKISYAIDRSADVRAQTWQVDLSGSCLKVQTPKGEVDIKTTLIGKHNIYNILAAVSVGVARGISLETIRQGLGDLRCIPGRLEPVEGEQLFSVFIDYAHTHDALENVLSSLRVMSEQKIILVFGCGGDRDKSKRSKMGRVASKLADFSIVTHDNPRSEDPGMIIDEILTGFDQENYEVVYDRREAIDKALSLANPKDIVLIAGKGHEDYQIIGTERKPFNEKEIIKACLQK